MTQVRTTSYAIWIMACIMTATGMLWALTLKKADLAELTRESSLVILGKVVDVEYRWQDDRHQAIYTLLTIEVEQFVKGSASRTLQVTQLGGTMGDIGQEVSGSPRFGEGDEVFLFLQEFQGAYWIHSIALGYFQVIEERDGQRYVLNDLRGINLVDAQTMQKVAPAEAYTFEPISSFIERVRQHLQ